MRYIKSSAKLEKKIVGLYVFSCTNKNGNFVKETYTSDYFVV